jgi:hypothetical protein
MGERLIRNIDAQERAEPFPALAGADIQHQQIIRTILEVM